MARLARAMAAFVVVAAASGCGLFEDATTFTIDTGWKSVELDADALGVAVPSGSTVPVIPCTQANDVCALGTSGISCRADTYGCQVRCGSQSSCEIVADAQFAQVVDVSDKVNNQTSASVVSKVSFQRMLFRVTQNTLTFATPQIKLLVGPNAAATIADSGVVEFTTMEPIPSAQQPDGELQATDAGKSALSGFVKDYANPFKILVQVGMGFGGGDALPRGKITVEVNGYFEVKP